MSEPFDDDELLHRQVFKGEVQDTRVSLDAMCPRSPSRGDSKDDGGELSVDRELLIGEPVNAYKKFTTNFKARPAAVASVAVEEVRALNLNCEQYDNPDDSHSFIDYNPLPDDEWETAAALLAMAANRRGPFIPDG